MRDSRLYRTVRNQSIEICIFLRHLQWRWPWYVESTLMNIVYINILFAISSFWISRKMQLDAVWSHRGAQDWTGTTLTLEIWLLVFLVCSSLMNYNLSYRSVCNSLSTHFFCNFVTAWQNQNQITEITDRFKFTYTSANFVF